MPDVADRLVDFLNTLDVEDDVDRLASTDSFTAWAGTPQDDTDLEAARELRAHLRSLAAGGTVDAELVVPVDVRLTTSAVLSSPTVVGEIAAAAARLAYEGRLDRIKICPADDCRWAFYDQSKNRSRTWCSMQVCGNRAKARNHRART